MTKIEKILEALRRSGDDPMTTYEIRNAIGFPSMGSCTAVLSKLTKSGRIVRVRLGHYAARKDER